jgi:hypothetical protein
LFSLPSCILGHHSILDFGLLAIRDGLYKPGSSLLWNVLNCLFMSFFLGGYIFSALCFQSLVIYVFSAFVSRIAKSLFDLQRIPFSDTALWLLASEMRHGFHLSSRTFNSLNLIIYVYL